MINPPARPELIYPIAEIAEPSDDQSRRAEKEERHKQALQVYHEEVRRNAEDSAKFNGLQIGDRSQLYLALGIEGQNAFHIKRKLDINFAEFWDLLKTTFTGTTNLT